MEELTYRASQLVDKVSRVLAGVQDEYSQAQQPEPDAHRYSAMENSSRRETKMSELAKAIHVRLVDLLDQVRGGIKAEEQAIDKAIHPLATSVSTYQQEQGRYEEQLAYRIVETVGFQKIEEEYDQAMKAGNVELATNLITWSERFSVGHQPEAVQAVENMKAKHVELLQLNTFILSKSALLKREKLVSERLAMLAGGFISPEQARNAQEYGELLKAGGVAADSLR